MNDYNAPRRLTALLCMVLLLSGCAYFAKKKHAPAPAAAPAPATSPAAAPATVAPPPASAPVLQETAPIRYTVKKGDTLWAIAGLYLKDPAAWPDIWYANSDIKNPHLIFPGDVLVLNNVGGHPSLTVERNGQVATEASPPPVIAAPAAVTTAPAAEPVAVTPAPVTVKPAAAPQPESNDNLPVTKLEPQIRYQPLSDAVPTLPLARIKAYLSKTRVVSKSELDHAGYLLGSMDERPAMGAGDEIYARDISQANGGRYELYRLGDAYVDPESGDKLGYQATYIGAGTVETWGDPTKLLLTVSPQEALPGDRLLPTSGDTELDASFMPHRPASSVKAQIMAVLGGVEQIGQFQVVVLNRGSDAGVDAGTVLDIYRSGGKIDDTYSPKFFGGGAIKVPPERSGTLMVFRAFKQVSYALVMQATHEIHLDDAVSSP